MPTDAMNRNLDDVKLTVLELLASLRNAGQVVLALDGGTAECDIDRALEVLTEGGELLVAFGRRSFRASVDEMKKSIKWFERGLVSKKELRSKLVSCAHEIVDAIEHSWDCEQRNEWAPATEIDRILSLLPDISDCGCESWDEMPETDSHLPLDYVIQRCRCAVVLIEQLVCRNERPDMSQQRAQLAAILAVTTTSDGLLVTDTFHGELPSGQIEGIVRHGGTIRLSALSSADARLLVKISGLIDDWYADGLNNRTLCRRLRSCLNEVNIADADWWDRFYSRLKDLWIVAFGKCSKKARASLTGDAIREEIHALLDDIEELVHAPLSQLTT